jgi:hypothetical protein
MVVQGSTYLSESAVALGDILEFDWLVTHYVKQFSLFLILYRYFISFPSHILPTNSSTLAALRKGYVAHNIYSTLLWS